MSASRTLLLGFAYLLLTLNALTGFAVDAVQQHGWLRAALNLFDVSAIVWLALAAGIALLWDARPLAPAGRGDTLLVAGAVLAALVPAPVVSSVALTLLATWLWCSGVPGSAMRRASAIFLSLTTFLLWGRLGLMLGAGPLLSADARFVSLLSGMPSVGDVVFFADGSQFRIAAGCSSFHGVSLALILWATVVQYFALRFDRRIWITLACAVLGAVLVNGIRLATIAWNPRQFDYWHTGTGGALFGWLALGVVVAIVYRGTAHARRLA